MRLEFSQSVNAMYISEYKLSRLITSNYQYIEKEVLVPRVVVSTYWNPIDRTLVIQKNNIKIKQKPSNK